jgi:hypothetical protein
VRSRPQKPMQSTKIHLSKKTLLRLNRRYPKTRITNISSRERALEILEIFLKRKHPKIVFRTAPKKTGADLRYQRTPNGSFCDVEVKGTADKDIAWGKLRMSGTTSCKGVRQGRPVYRVFDVYSDSPQLRILKWNKDFTLKEEPRWTFIEKK